jgi:hypothetical protein
MFFGCIASLRESGCPAAPSPKAEAPPLIHDEITEGNTFAHPDRVSLTPFPVTIRGDGADITIRRHSVVSLELRTV